MMNAAPLGVCKQPDVGADLKPLADDSPENSKWAAGNAGNRGIPGNTGIEGIRLGIH